MIEFSGFWWQSQSASASFAANRPSHVVDGNEIGDAIDVFVASRDPVAAFAMCRPMLGRLGLIDTVVVAHAPDGAGPFTVIHPADFAGVFTV